MEKNINKEKQKLQNEAILLFLSNKAIMLNWCTGASKSLAAIKCIDSYKTFEKKYPKVLLLVAEELHKENWKSEFKKWKFDHLLPEVIIECYPSVKKYTGQSFDILLSDECHHISDLKKEYLLNINFNKAILLSATVAKDIKDRISKIIPFKEFIVTLDEAIERGILPPPIIHLIPVELDGKLKRNEVKLKGKTFLSTDKAKNTSFEVQMKKLQEFEKKLKEEKKSYTWLGMKMTILGGQRKKFLAGCKTEAAKKLIQELESKRFICFTGSTEQCEELGGPNSLNSSRGKKHNISTLEKFNNKEIDSLFVNKMGKEGLNLEEIEAAIIVQLDSGNDDGLSFIQKLGRSLRAIQPELYILYCKGTQDEIYLKRALLKIDKKYINTKI